MPRHCVLHTANCALQEQGLLRDDVKYQLGCISCAFPRYKCVNFMTCVIQFLLKRLNLPTRTGYCSIVVITPQHFAPVIGPQHYDPAKHEFLKLALKVALPVQ